MTNKYFQTNHKNQRLNTEATGVEGLVIGQLELAIRVVASATGLPTFIVGVVSLVIKPPTPVDKTTSSVTKPLASVMAWLL